MLIILLISVEHHRSHSVVYAEILINPAPSEGPKCIFLWDLNARELVAMVTIECKFPRTSQTINQTDEERAREVNISVKK